MTIINKHNLIVNYTKLNVLPPLIKIKDAIYY